MRFVTLGLAAPVLLAGVSFAQSFNVDVGGGAIGVPGYGLPTPAFGAGAAQPGTWNAIDPALAGTPVLLANLSGAPTAVTFARTVGSGGQFNVNNAATTGDDELFMDDCDFPPGTGATWSFVGLAAGTYEVYTYAWAPDLATYLSRVSVNGGPMSCVGGTFAGTYVAGITHALDTVTIAAGVPIDVVFNNPPCTSYHTFNGMQIKQISGGAVGTPECFGDTAAACPCSAGGGSLIPNPGAAGNGCGNSAFAAGANLSAAGNAVDNAGDTLVLTCSNMPGPGLFFQSNGLAGPIVNFNDGALCAAVGIIRMGVVFPAAGVAAYPGGLTPAPIHVAGAPVLAPTPTKHYQCWYRDITVGFCNTAGHNMSNGLAVVWAP